MSENGEPKSSRREWEQTTTKEFGSDDPPTYDLSDGTRIIVSFEANGKVMATVIDKDDNRRLVTYSEADFAALIGNTEANQPPVDNSTETDPPTDATAKPGKDRESLGQIPKDFVFGDMFLAINSEGMKNIHVLGAEGDRVTVGIEEPKGQAEESWSKAQLARYLEDEGAQFVSNVNNIGVEQRPEPQVAQQDPILDNEATESHTPEENKEPVEPAPEASPEPVQTQWAPPTFPSEAKEPAEAPVEPAAEPISAPDDVAESVEAQPADEPEDDPEEPASDPAEQRQTAGEQLGEQRQIEIMIGGLRVKYKRLGDENTPEARRIKRQIDRLERRLADGIPDAPEPEFALTPEPEQKTGDEVQAELDEVNAELRDITDTESLDSKALEARAADLRELLAQIDNRKQLEIRLDALKTDYDQIDFKYTVAAQDLLREILQLQAQLDDGAPEGPEAALAPEPEKKTGDELEAELDEVNAKLMSMKGTKSPEVKALKARAKELHELIIAEFGEDDEENWERLGDELEKARNEYDGLDKNTPRAKELKRRIKELHELIIADFNKDADEDDPEDEPEEPEEDEAARKLRKEREKEAKERVKSIDQEMRSTKLFEKYRKALNAYGELKATHDTKNPRYGRYKREQALLRAEKELIKTRKALARETIDRRKQAGLYSGEDELEVKQAMSDDLFDEIRKIDPETRRMTTKVLEERQKGRDRNPILRLSVGLGRFLNRGEKASTRYAKYAGAGAAAGIVKGAALGFFSATWPVSAGVIVAGSTALSFAARYGSKTAYLDEALKTHTDKKGKAIPQLDNKQYRKLIDSYKDGVDYASKKGEKDISDRLAREILSGAREAGAKERDDAKKKAAKNMLAFGLGSLAGGFSARAVHDLWGSLHPSLPTGPGSSSAASVVPHPNEGTSPNVRYPEAVPQAAPEVTPTVDHIPTGHVNLGGAKFPWNYAANHVGANNASAELQSRAAQAAARGHRIQWYRTISGGQALRVDGSDNTQGIIDVLWGNN